jgi:hypothetical protein
MISVLRTADVTHKILSVNVINEHLLAANICVKRDDQKVSLHLMITIQKVTSNVQSVPSTLQTFIDTPKCFLEDRV